MKRYAIILAILVLVGVALAYYLLVQEKQTGKSVLDEAIVSLGELHVLDQKLNIELNNSRFNLSYNHDTLFDLNFEISEKFDELRFGILIDHIEVGTPVDLALSNFSNNFLEREQELERYVEINSLVSKGLNDALTITADLQTSFLGDQAHELNDLVSKTNDEIYRFTLSDTFDESEVATQNKLIAQLTELQFEVPQNLTIPLANYKSATQAVFDNHQAAKLSFEQLKATPDDVDISSIQDAFARQHFSEPFISKTATFILLAYITCVIAGLIISGWRLQQNRVLLEERASALEIRAKELESEYVELRESQEQVIQSEKMSSLGQMVAGVAHEINTPLGYVSGNINALKENFSELRLIFSKLDEILLVVKEPGRESTNITKRLVSTLRAYKRLRGPELMEESEELINDGDYGLLEMARLVNTLKDFSRLDRQSTEQVDIHECIKSSIIIASNHIRDNNVTVVESYATLPKISCFPSKINQVFLNIITNACQAMARRGGELMIITERQRNWLVIRFADQGVGMDEETEQKMFDPFFTSKDIGEGTGLGMSIAYKIIQAHNGKIDVKTTVGEGTVISISLPIDESEMSEYV